SLGEADRTVLQLSHRVDARGQDCAQHRIAGKAGYDPAIQTEAHGVRAVDGRAGKTLRCILGHAVGLRPHAARSVCPGENSWTEMPVSDRLTRWCSNQPASPLEAAPASQRARAGAIKAA